jgi:excisionase family DNA binding protein
MPALILPDKDFLRIDEVAVITRKTKKTVYRWCKAGRLDWVRVGERGMLVPTTAVCQIIKLSSACYVED